MSDDTLDARLHDFLDGRMSAAERADFEARLRRDPQLAARCEAYREIGDALRDDADVSLPPGFYTRARAQFEAAGAPRRWFRPLSWESLGVAAAALFALAVFVPHWVDDGSPLPTVREPEASRPAADADAPTAQKMADDAVRAEKAAPPEVGAKRSDTPALRDEAEDVKEERVTIGVDPTTENEEAYAPEAPPATPRSQALQSRASDPATPRPPGPAAGRGVEGSHAERSGPGDVAAPRQAAARAVAQDEPSEARDPDADREAVLAKLLALGETAEPFAAQPIDRPVLERGAVLVVDDLATLRKAGKDAREEGAGAAPGAPDPATAEEKASPRKKAVAPVRWLLIGPRDAPFVCAGFKISSENDAWVVRLAPPDAERPAAPHGCVLTLPRDGKPVRVVGP